MPVMQTIRTVSARLAIAALAVCGFPAGAWAQIHAAGAIGPGSFYEIDVPAGWNGDLVIYAHGIVQASEPVAAPTDQDGFNLLRSYLLTNGFAVAASSYSSNGWSLADAVRRTHQLSGIFVATAGRPGHTFLAGHSMGALAIVKMAETYGRQYDGVLAMCGPLGGGQQEIDYAGNARVTFDFYFPGVLPGTTFDVPPGTEYLSPYDPGGPSPLFLSVMSAVMSNPDKTAMWASAANLPFADATELGYSALYMPGFLMRYTNDLVERVNGKIPFDNSTTTYQVNVADPLTNAYLSSQLNAGVDRFVEDRAAFNYYERNYKPTGAIAVPVITLHTTRDPAIPIAHEGVFAAAVASAGRSNLLVQRSIDRWGHCAFDPSEVAGAFTDLVTWVKGGVHP